ncbi:ribbon-helix-helix protein, CopG family [Sphingobium xenophagum]|tara:strand:- start:4874 stop:5020 length:147 start_codon:yes stop_codon:yes gene_type:complete
MNSLQNTSLRIRVNDALIAAANERARQQGMSLSEFMRSALRQQLSKAA